MLGGRDRRLGGSGAPSTELHSRAEDQRLGRAAGGAGPGVCARGRMEPKTEDALAQWFRLELELEGSLDAPLEGALEVALRSRLEDALEVEVVQDSVAADSP